MNIITPAHGLQTLLARIDLQNAAYNLNTLADNARRNSPKLAEIMDALASDISEKLEQMQAMIKAQIKAEQAENAAEKED